MQHLAGDLPELTGCVLLFDAACTVSAGCVDEEAEAAMAGRQSAIVPKCGYLKCQSYY